MALTTTALQPTFSTLTDHLHDSDTVALSLFNFAQKVAMASRDIQSRGDLSPFNADIPIINLKMTELDNEQFISYVASFFASLFIENKLRNPSQQGVRHFVSRMRLKIADAAQKAFQASCLDGMMESIDPTGGPLKGITYASFTLNSALDRLLDNEDVPDAIFTEKCTTKEHEDVIYPDVLTNCFYFSALFSLFEGGEMAVERHILSSYDFFKRLACLRGEGYQHFDSKISRIFPMRPYQCDISHTLFVANALILEANVRRKPGMDNYKLPELHQAIIGHVTKQRLLKDQIGEIREYIDYYSNK